jgi:hypothetical protein
VGGASCCGFHTTWGDGLFPVWVDRASDGSLVQVRIELATPQTVKNMLEVNGLTDEPPEAGDDAAPDAAQDE